MALPDGVVGEEPVTSSCNPGGPCLAFLDSRRLGYVDRKWTDHLLAHAREARRRPTLQVTLGLSKRRVDERRQLGRREPEQVIGAWITRVAGRLGYPPSALTNWTVDVSETHADYFIRNRVALRATVTLQQKEDDDD